MPNDSDAIRRLQEAAERMEAEQTKLREEVRKAVARPPTRSEFRRQAREHMTAGLREHFGKEAGDDD